MTIEFKDIALGVICVCLTSACTSVVEISEASVNTTASLAFPKETLGISIHDPKIQLAEGNTIICAIATPKFLRYDVRFCASLIPEWHPATGSLHATKLVMTSIYANGLDSRNAQLVQDSITRNLSPLLEGFPLYQSHSGLAKSVSTVTVKTGKIVLTF
jgi:hypothetical protein